MSEATALVEQLRERHGDGLRVVATYNEGSYEIHYIDEDATDAYTTVDFDDIHDDVVLQDIEQPFQESLFHELGEIRGKLRLFEDGLVAHFWPTGDVSDGVFVAFGTDTEVSPRALLTLAEQHYS
ncbi:hypothetical protein [Halosegnis longus]|uniref:Uncharacterized protein n=1 Tax=Halosegnis longus TaxID=2216012 RepID=A0AAJ4R8W7_9EURY|nr:MULTISPECIES: hypothetical protein [Halobacteriales]RNJ26297.1 hypothetical protein Nmn1133_06150 [Salella cibi]